MTTITEFLLARIAEDEAVAREVSNWDAHVAHEIDGFSANALRFASHVTPARILAECKAKRAIVAEHVKASLVNECVVCCDEAQSSPGDIAFEIYPCPTLSHLASVYADHEDCRAEWAL